VGAEGVHRRSACAHLVLVILAEVRVRNSAAIGVGPTIELAELDAIEFAGRSVIA
jgi:hypothetical protein